MQPLVSQPWCSTTKPSSNASWEAKISPKRLSYSSDAAFLKVTNAEGQSIKPNHSNGYLAYRTDSLREGSEDYDLLELTPTTMEVEGQRPGVYKLQLVVKGRQGIGFGYVRTNAGIVDIIRHDDSTASITFDDRRIREGMFSFSYIDFTRENMGLTVRGLPVIPGATFKFDIDWQALREDHPSLTIAIDTDNDGQPEHSSKIGRQLGNQKWMEELELTPEMAEYAELFGIGTENEVKK